MSFHPRCTSWTFEKDKTIEEKDKALAEKDELIKELMKKIGKE